MFMALSETKVVHAELKLPQGQLEHPGFLVQFQATLVVADYRKAGDAGWSGKYYGPEYDFPRRVFSEAQPELEKSGCMGFVRKSAAMMNQGKSGDVLVVLPPAIPRLEVLSITPLGDPNVNATITLPDGTTHPVQNYYSSASAKASADEALSEEATTRDPSNL